MDELLLTIKSVASAISKTIERTINPSSSSSSSSLSKPSLSARNNNHNHHSHNTNTRTNNSNTNSEIDGKEIAIKLGLDIFQLFISGIISWYFYKWILRQNVAKYQSNNGSSSSADSRERLAKLLMEREVAKLINEQGGVAMEGGEQQQERQIVALKEKVKRQIIKSLDLNQYENAIADDVIDPADIQVTFADVGGIDHIKTELWDLVVLPIIRPDIFISQSGLVSPPRGILLFGAPGTGKTMLAKAIAKESGATFVNVRLSNIMDKWFGESNKLVSATFSLARKLAPSVIFIDEIDTFLNQRDSSEGTATTSMKSEFLTLWDGMLSDSGQNAAVTVLGATNRPYDVDSAILRRLPRAFEIGLPNEDSRLQILHLFLKKQEMTEGARQMIPRLAKITKGYSGSDLKELCRAAAMAPVREVTKDMSKRAVSGLKNTDVAAEDTTNNIHQSPMGIKFDKVRPVSETDFMEALKKVKRTGEAARNFLRRENSCNSTDSVRSNGSESNNYKDIAQAVRMINLMMSAASNGNINEEDAREADKDDEVPSLN